MKILAAVIMMLTTALLSACTDTAETDVIRTIKGYNEAAIAAYRTGTAKPLLAHAAEKEVNKVQVLVDLKTSNRLILESELQKFEVLSSVREADDRYDVRTKERWKYYDRPLRVGVAPGPVFIADIYLQYTVQREGESWKVQKVKAEKTDYIQGTDPAGNTGSKREKAG